MKKTNEEEAERLVKDFFTDIKPQEFNDYLSDLTSDAMLGCENNRLKNSNRVTMLTKTIAFINQLNRIFTRKKCNLE